MLHMCIREECNAQAQIELRRELQQLQFSLVQVSTQSSNDHDFVDDVEEPPEVEW